MSVNCNFFVGCVRGEIAQPRQVAKSIALCSFLGQLSAGRKLTMWSSFVQAGSAAVHLHETRVSFVALEF